MLEQYRDKLFSWENKYISIGITGDGNSVGMISVPWESTAHAFNMKTPDIYLTPNDIKDQAVLNRLAEKCVDGCYIFEPLQDYSFIARFADLRDIYICNGSNIKDLSFFSDLCRCRMLYLEDVTLDSIDELCSEKRAENFKDGLCLGLFNCYIKDISVLEKNDLCLYELVIFSCAGNAEFDRWKNVHALKRTYYTLKRK